MVVKHAVVVGLLGGRLLQLDDLLLLLVVDDVVVAGKVEPGRRGEQQVVGFVQFLEHLVLLLLLNALGSGVGVNLDDHLHVVSGATAADSSMQVIAGGSGDEVVILTRSKFKAAGSRGERSEGDGEEHFLLWSVAQSDDPWLGVGNAARVKFLLGHAVDDVTFGESGSGLGLRADQVDLIVFLNVDDVVGVVDAEHRRILVPEDCFSVIFGGKSLVKGEESQRDNNSDFGKHFLF